MGKHWGETNRKFQWGHRVCRLDREPSAGYLNEKRRHL